MKTIRVFLSENFQFLEVKFSIYLNRRVFVMWFVDSSYTVKTIISLHYCALTSLGKTFVYLAFYSKWKKLFVSDNIVSENIYRFYFIAFF